MRNLNILLAILGLAAASLSLAMTVMAPPPFSDITAGFAFVGLVLLILVAQYRKDRLRAEFGIPGVVEKTSSIFNRFLAVSVPVLLVFGLVLVIRLLSVAKI